MAADPMDLAMDALMLLLSRFSLFSLGLLTIIIASRRVVQQERETLPEKQDSMGIIFLVLIIN